MSTDVLAKVVVTIVLMIAVRFWMAMQRAHTAHCKDCPTDISAVGR